MNNFMYGINTVSKSTPVIKNNEITKNDFGIFIEDPSQPILASNIVTENTYQVKLDRNS